ncbi:MAG: N-methyl-D-aspartate receptor NMDAR2C subunit [Anaerolineae bacterium]
MTTWQRFERLWLQLGARTPGQAVFRWLVESYSQEGRAYHNLAHVSDCLDLFDRFQHLARHPAEVEIAIWFHDAVYDTRANDNEQRSADEALRALRRAAVPEPAPRRVSDLILATRHQTSPAGPDAALLVDIDLSILGHAPQVFDAYERQVRAEYAWVPADAFRQARVRLLRRFLQRESIYRTDAFRVLFEDQARRNLARSIRRLEPPHSAV